MTSPAEPIALETEILHPDPVEMALQANLTYVDEHQPGYQRVRRGRGFVFRAPDGTLLRTGERLTQIQQLVIPPAWTDVWICADPDGHIQATGRDERGRKQYIYHPDWALIRDQVKFNRLLPFAEALPALREQVDQDLRGRKLTWEKVAAIAVKVLDKTRIRIGNPEYMRQNDSYGLTTLQDDHVAIEGDRITIEFQGKSGKQHTIELHDRRLAKLVRQCQELPGQELFQYIGDDGLQHTLRSNDVNLYLRTVTGRDFTAKDFRTWGGTVTTLRALGEHGADKAGSDLSETARKRAISVAIKAAAQALGNTTTVCRKYYVHPAVIAAYQEGTLQSAIEAAADEAAPALDPYETAVRLLLRRYADDEEATLTAQRTMRDVEAECT